MKWDLQIVNEPALIANYLLLAALWLGYFVLHSALASLQAKSWVATHYPQVMPLYRLGYNILALVLLWPILGLMVHNPGPVVWAWHGMGAWLANGLALLAIMGLIYSLKAYDGSEFMGLRQWRAKSCNVEEQEHFHLSPLHRHVRHPWYFLALVLIWTRDMNAAMLLSSILITAYLIIGSKLEEAKLVVYYGKTYLQYMQRVPGLFPLPGRTISAAEAAELVKAAKA